MRQSRTQLRVCVSRQLLRCVCVCVCVCVCASTAYAVCVCVCARVCISTVYAVSARARARVVHVCVRVSVCFHSVPVVQNYTTHHSERSVVDAAVAVALSLGRGARRRAHPPGGGGASRPGASCPAARGAAPAAPGGRAAAAAGRALAGAERRVAGLAGRGGAMLLLLRGHDVRRATRGQHRLRRCNGKIWIATCPQIHAHVILFVLTGT